MTTKAQNHDRQDTMNQALTDSTPTTELQALNLSLPIGSLEAYIAQVNQIPLLTQQEELALAERLHQQNDLEAARRLVMAHLRYVVKVARGYLGYGLPLGDLIQEGNIGLMKAVKRFDPAVGVRLVTFAMHWIKAEIHEFVLRNWRIVKMATTKAQRKLFFNLRRMKKHTGWLTQQETDAIAEDLNVKRETVREMETRLSTRDMSFDGTPGEEEDDSPFCPASLLEDNRYNPATEYESSDWAERAGGALQNALAQLDPRSQDILEARWLADEKATLQDLAERYHVSAERIRQLEKNAMQKLRLALEDIQAAG